MLQHLDSHFKPHWVSFTPTETPNPQVPSTLGWNTPFLGLPQMEYDSMTVMIRAQTDRLGSWCPLSAMCTISASALYLGKEELQDVSWPLMALSRGH